MKKFTKKEVEKHNQENDCWIIVNGKVYDVTKFINFHPGGRQILIKNAGTESTNLFVQFHKLDLLKKYERFVVGEIEGKVLEKLNNDVNFGSLVPYSEPLWYQGFSSPYYNDSHRRFRKECRKFVEEEIIPNAYDWEENRIFPKGIHNKLFKKGFYGSVLGGKWPKVFFYIL
jgi:predicted heme/steroid binding protein